MNIYRVEPALNINGDALFQSIGLANSRDVVGLSKLFAGSRAAVAAGWIPPTYGVTGDKSKAPADFPFSTEIHLLVEQRAVDCLRPVFGRHGDFYRVNAPELSGIYWLYYCWDMPDVLNPDETIMRTQYRVQTAVFREGVNVPDVFTLNEEPTGLFVSERVRSLIMDNELSGLSFELVGVARESMC